MSRWSRSRTPLQYRLKGRFGTSFVVTDDTVQARGLASVRGLSVAVRTVMRADVTGLVLVRCTGLQTKPIVVPVVVARDGAELQIVPLSRADTSGNREEVLRLLAPVAAALGLSGEVPTRHDR